MDLEIFNQPKDYKGSKLTDVETFEETFGPKMRRNKPKVESNTLEELAAIA